MCSTIWEHAIRSSSGLSRYESASARQSSARGSALSYRPSCSCSLASERTAERSARPNSDHAMPSRRGVEGEAGGNVRSAATTDGGRARSCCSHSPTTSAITSASTSGSGTVSPSQVEDLVDRAAALAQRRRLVRAQPQHLAAGAVNAHGGVRGVREWLVLMVAGAGPCRRRALVVGSSRLPLGPLSGLARPEPLRPRRRRSCDGERLLGERRDGEPAVAGGAIGLTMVHTA